MVALMTDNSNGIGYTQGERKEFRKVAEELNLIEETSKDSNYARYQISPLGVATYLESLIIMTSAGILSIYELDKRIALLEGQGLPADILKPEALSQNMWIDKDGLNKNSILISGRDVEHFKYNDWSNLKNNVLRQLENKFNNNPNNSLEA